MKVKLKGQPVRKSFSDVVNGKYLGIDLYTWKKINHGETVEINSIPKEAEEYLVSVGEKNKNKLKKETFKGDR